MKPKMRTTISLLLLLITLMVEHSFAQKIPFVYDVENTGAKFPKPVLPSFDQLSIIEPLYVTVKTGKQSMKAAPTDSASAIYFPFKVEADGNFYIHARLNSLPSNPDSYWVKIDNGSFTNLNGFVISGWEWKKLNRYTMKAGEHTFAIALRNDGVKLDKISISNDLYAPDKMGDAAETICDPTVRENIIQSK